MDSVRDMWLSLMKQGMSLPDIDGMDILFYFELLGHSTKEKFVPIDQVGFL